MNEAAPGSFQVRSKRSSLLLHRLCLTRVLLLPVVCSVELELIVNEEVWVCFFSRVVWGKAAQCLLGL